MTAVNQHSFFDILDQHSVCESCGIGISVNKRGRPKTRCAKCAKIKEKEYKSGERYKSLMRAAHLKKRLLNLHNIPERYCKNCHSSISPPRRKFCSLQCTWAWKTKQDTDAVKARFGGEYPVLNCAECDAEFVGKPYGQRPRRFCSKPCARRSILRIRTRARRAIEQGVEIYEFDPTDVMRRDKWKCQACGIDTPKHLRGKHEPASPELDHIIPISRGGDHSFDNCRCLCHACNMKKFNRTDEEWKAGVRARHGEGYEAPSL